MRLCRAWPVLPILCSIALLSACGDKEIVVPVVKLERVEIDRQLLEPPSLPPAPRHPDQRRRSAIALELLGNAFNACVAQIGAIRDQHDRAINKETKR
jgi:hypothetical protein